MVDIGDVRFRIQIMQKICRDDDTDEAGVWRQDAGEERDEMVGIGDVRFRIQIMQKIAGMMIQMRPVYGDKVLERSEIKGLASGAFNFVYR
jgi:hypothetical protein